MARSQLPAGTRGEIIHLSRNKCVVCLSPGKQFHHIDGNHGNDDFQNIALLCTVCHDNAETKSTMTRHLRPDEIRHCRDRVYDLHRRQMDQAASTSADSETQFLDVLGVHEVRKLRHKIGNDMGEYLAHCEEMACYVSGYGPRTAVEMLYTLSDVAHIARIDKGPMVAVRAVRHACVELLWGDWVSGDADEELEAQIHDIAAEIGFEFAYGSIRYQRDWSHIYFGADIICTILRKGTRRRSKAIVEAGEEAFSRCVECVEEYNFPEAMELLNFMRSDALGKGEVDYPSHIFDKIQLH